MNDHEPTRRHVTSGGQIHLAGAIHGSIGVTGRSRIRHGSFRLRSPTAKARGFLLAQELLDGFVLVHHPLLCTLEVLELVRTGVAAWQVPLRVPRRGPEALQPTVPREPFQGRDVSRRVHLVRELLLISSQPAAALQFFLVVALILRHVASGARGSCAVIIWVCVCCEGHSHHDFTTMHASRRTHVVAVTEIIRVCHASTSTCTCTHAGASASHGRILAEGRWTVTSHHLHAAVVRLVTGVTL